MAEEQLTHVQEHTQNDGVHPGKRGLGRPPKVAPSLAQATQEVEVPRQAGNASRGSASKTPRAFAPSATRTPLSTWSEVCGATASL